MHFVHIFPLPRKWDKSCNIAHRWGQSFLITATVGWKRFWRVPQRVYHSTSSESSATICCLYSPVYIDRVTILNQFLHSPQTETAKECTYFRVFNPKSDYNKCHKFIHYPYPNLTVDYCFMAPSGHGLKVSTIYCCKNLVVRLLKRLNMDPWNFQIFLHICKRTEIILVLVQEQISSTATLVRHPRF